VKKIINLKNIYLYILILFGIITHIEWFNPYSVLNDSDWGFLHNETIKSLNISFGSWVNMFGFGGTNIQIYFNIFKIAWYTIGYLGFSYDIATKTTFLIPIAIGGFIAPYILMRKIIKDNFIAFIGALFYGTTTYFLLRQTAHIPVAFIYMIAPLFLYCFIDTIENNKTINWIVFSLLNLIMIGYELRMVYILYWIILIYWVVFFKKKYLGLNYIKNYIIYGVITLLLNLYWLLPTVQGSVSTIESTANRGLFGGFLFNIKRAITISEAAWTGSYPNMDFTPQVIPVYLFIVPIVITIGLTLIGSSKDKNQRKLAIFFGIVSLLGITLTTQQSPPFPDLYEWLYKNFPGFNLFREASKFYLITAIGYLGLLALSLKLIKDKLYKIKLEKIYFLLCIILIASFVYNTKPLITREIRTMFVSKEIPEDYIKFKDKVLEENNHFRTFWTPTYSRYGLFTIRNSVVSNVSYISKLQNVLNLDPSQSLEKNLIQVYNKDYSNNLFNNSNIKYIVVPIRDIGNDDNFFRFYGEQSNPNIRDWYINELDKIDWLEKKDFGFQELVVYENKDYKDRIYLTQEPETIYKDIPDKKVEFTQINSAEYRVKINNLDETAYLNFVEAYDPNWKMRIGDFDWEEALYNKNYFIDDSKHTKSEIEFNNFELSKDYIKANFDKSMYKENPDGSIDLELTLYFKPQSYFYLGIIISGTTLILCLGYLGYTWVRRRGKSSSERGKNTPPRQENPATPQFISRRERGERRTKSSVHTHQRRSEEKTL
jgi:hypothetical protein